MTRRHGNPLTRRGWQAVALALACLVLATLIARALIGH